MSALLKKSVSVMPGSRLVMVTLRVLVFFLNGFGERIHEGFGGVVHGLQRAGQLAGNAAHQQNLALVAGHHLLQI